MATKPKLTNEVAPRVSATDFPADRPATAADLLAPQVETDIAVVNNMEYAKQLAFNEELIEIEVPRSSDKNEEAVIPVGVNGVMQYVTRGQRQWIRRKYVEAMMSKQDSLSTPYRKGPDNEDTYGIEHSESFRYPVIVHTDPSGELGRNWFQALTNR